MAFGRIMEQDAAPRAAEYGPLRERRGAGAPVRVTVVTAAFNAARTIERTIDSVQAQDLPGVEHVVVDGGSSDGTRGVLARRLRPSDFWISEKDRGISDAFNKGVLLARGEAVLFLGADDWLSEGQIRRAFETLGREGCDFVFGDVVFHEEGRPSFRYSGDPGYRRILRRRMPALNHPSVLARRSCFERAGLFSLSWRCAMEYDWFLRLDAAGGRGVHDPEIVVNMTHEGVSNRMFLRTIEEVRQISVLHGRAALPAALEAAARGLKTRASFAVRGRSETAYRLARRAINPSYRPLRWTP